MKKMKPLVALIGASVMLALSLTGCTVSDGAEACKSSETSGSVCYHDMEVERMHQQAANASDSVVLINFVPSREFQEATGLATTDDMLGTAQRISGLAPVGWKISAVSGLVQKKGEQSSPLRTITFRRVTTSTTNP